MRIPTRVKTLSAGMLLGVALLFATPARADKACEADCEESTAECVSACKQYGGEGMGRCLQACKEVEAECFKECNEPDDYEDE